jgi:hypothetical protein
MMKGQAHVAAPGPFEPPPAGEMHGGGGDDTSSTASPAHAAPPPQPPPPPPPGAGAANLNGHVPQLSARGADAVRGNSALPWSQVDGIGGSDPDGSGLDSRDEVGGPARSAVYGDDSGYGDSGGGGLFRSAGGSGERSYRAYHPESITLDVEGDIGDA